MVVVYQGWWSVKLTKGGGLLTKAGGPLTKGGGPLTKGGVKVVVR